MSKEAFSHCDNLDQSVKMLKNISKKGMRMKKLILAVVLGIGIATSLYASTDISSIRGSTEFVEIGNTQARMVDVLGNPESSFKHIIHDRKGWPHAAVSYIYSVNGQRYTIVVVDGKIYRIIWER